MSSVETRLDGSTLIVRIPMRFQRHGSRKRIVAPDGSEIAPTMKPQPDGTLVKALARAWRWQRCSMMACTPRSAKPGRRRGSARVTRAGSCGWRAAGAGDHRGDPG